MKRFSILFLLFFSISTLMVGQNYPAKMPLDPNTKVGRLENGLTYYIRHNENPKNRADFYIVNNVGAMQEEDNQNGLAHFLEHLAFNGLKHFPQQQMTEFLGANGVKFGGNINAYTSRERTVYNISDVPLLRDSFIDSVLLILHDWSYYILCEPEQLEAERGVIKEEWKLGDNSRSRLQDKQDSLTYMGSKYPKRNVIGDYNIINNFKREALIDFYHKWYRPDLQAVIIVGDIDVQEMEAKVKRVLSPLPKIENGAKKEVYEIPYHSTPIIGTITDPDVKYFTTKFILKQAFPSQEELQMTAAYKNNYMRDIFTEIISDRLTKVQSTDESPFEIAVAVNSQMEQCRYMTLFTTTAKEEKNLLGLLEALLIEFKRLEKHGINRGEFEIAKQTIYKFSGLKSDIKPSDVESEMLVNSYVEHFTTGVPYCEPIEQQKILRKVFESITLEDINAFIPYMLTESEKVVYFTMHDSDAHFAPSEKEALDIFAKVEAMDLAPFEWADKDISQLKVENLKGGKIVETVHHDDNVREWTLSNGIKVYWSQMKESQMGIDMAVTGMAKGGYALHDDIQALKLVDNYASRMGVRDFSFDQLQTALKTADTRARVSIDRGTTSLIGSSSKEEFEQMLSLLYLHVTEPNFDSKEYAKFIKHAKDNLTKEKSAQTKFDDSATLVLYDNHEWAQYLTTETCDRVDVKQAEEIYKKHFSNMRDYKFFISGTLSEEEVRPMVEKYIGSLPTNLESAVLPKSTYRYVQKNVDCRGEGAEKEIPKSQVTTVFHGDVAYTAENNMIFKYLNNILSQRYMTSIREEKGGTYHVAVKTILSSGFGGWYDITVAFETDPKLEAELLEEVKKGVADLALNGPTDNEMEEIRAYLLKVNEQMAPTRAKTTFYSQERLINKYFYGVDLKEDDASLIGSITATKVKEAAQTVLNNYSFIAVFSEKYKK